MKSICFGVSLIASLTATEAYAMLEISDLETNPRYIQPSSPPQQSPTQTKGEENDEEGLAFLDEGLIHLVTRGKDYFYQHQNGLFSLKILTICEEALKNELNTPEEIANIYVYRAVAWEHLNNYDEALKDFQKALGIKKSEGRGVIPEEDQVEVLHHIVAMLFQGQKEKNKAIEAYKSILELKDKSGRVVVGGPERVNTYCQLAHALTETEQYHEAATNYYKALFSKDWQGSFYLMGYSRGEIMRALEDLREKLAQRDEVVKHSQDNRIYQEENLGSLKKNIEDLRRMIGKVPAFTFDQAMNRSLAKHRAQMLIKEGDKADKLLEYDEALAYYMQALSLTSEWAYSLTDSEIAKTFMKIGSILDKQRMPKDSLKVYGLALKTKNEQGKVALNDNDRRTILLTRERIKNDKRRIDPPKSMIPGPSKRRKVEHEGVSDGAEKSIPEQIAFIQSALSPAGERDKALKICNALLGSSSNLDEPKLTQPQKAKVFSLKGELLKKQGKFAEALNAFQACIDLRGWVGEDTWMEEDLANAFFAMGECYEKLIPPRNKDAMAFYRNALDLKKLNGKKFALNLEKRRLISRKMKEIKKMLPEEPHKSQLAKMRMKALLNDDASRGRH